LLEQGESLRREQLEAFFAASPSLTLEQKMKCEEFSKKLTKQLLHAPLRGLRKTSEVQELRNFFEGMFQAYTEPLSGEFSK
jgi:glutamyl-tRNA reductase